MSSRWLAAGSALVLAAVLAACTSQPAQPAQPAKVPVFATSTVRAVPVRTTLPKGCSDVASATEVDTIVGHPLVGSSREVVGVPEPKINRTGRLDCYFGIPAGKPATSGVVSIGIGRYTDATSAAHRTTVTVNSARADGASVSDIRVNGGDALLVADSKIQELVLSRGDLTVLAIANNGVLPAGKVGPGLTALAMRALDAP